ncbi:MAG: hypothetical protein A3B37_01805 [Candidatus Sungbacteria bacterium RIFCSPLOWO2_01_FULL_59_16]|uniref:Short-chain dehydrogenase n=1 Tax=Candidatus Sungbacteria bacterium RIFCSPLOWO2_01_FULL_59_16 TaxID=1802280 RepID=A0A1G2LAK5_9BACT|nr:MAG: hypothetical protein A3B37_01805 [Candidatus Sungbacteria bacterium RIFCSPLOWO2_01_FULL_59_16]
METPKEPFSVRDKVVIITGGAGLLGREYAAFLSVAGARVVLFDIADDPKFPEGTVARYMKVDITDREAVFAAVADVAKEYGQVDVLINNAAMNPVPGTEESAKQFSPYEDYPVELWERELKVGLTGALLCTQAVIPVMKRQGSGSIVNISSTYGNVGPDNRIYDEGKYKSIGYATVKGAVLNVTRAWASYLRGTGIRVNTLTPGGVFAGQPESFVKAYEERTILGRMARKEEYNGAILFLASDASSYMTGANLVVDGGWTAW